MDLNFFDDAPEEGPLRILVVCTGNVCRSPLTAALLEQALDGLPVEVDSAGTQALVGAGMPAPNQVIARGLGIAAPDAHAAKQLEAVHLDWADLVVALDREHRRLVAELKPAAAKISFTLRELARLANAEMCDELTTPTDPGARMRQLLASVASMRGLVPPPAEPEDDDVIDPYRQSEEVYALSARQITDAVAPVVRLLGAAAQREPRSS